MSVKSIQYILNVNSPEAHSIPSHHPNILAFDNKWQHSKVLNYTVFAALSLIFQETNYQVRRNDSLQPFSDGLEFFFYERHGRFPVLSSPALQSQQAQSCPSGPPSAVFWAATASGAELAQDMKPFVFSDLKENFMKK